MIIDSPLNTTAVRLLALVVALLLLGAGWQIFSSVEQPVAQAEPHIRFQDCPLERADLKLRCASLYTRGVKLGYELPIVVIEPLINDQGLAQDGTQTEAAGQQAAALFLGGGPGSSVGISRSELKSWVSWYYSAGLTGPLVLMEYRGSGSARPQFHCRQFSAAYRSAQMGQGDGSLLDIIEDCWQIWQQRGVTAEDFSARANAQDANRAMSELGFNQYHIIASSYGTQVAQELMIATPGNIHSAILDGAVNPHTSGINSWPARLTSIFKNLDAHCQRSNRCQLSDETWRVLFAQLQEQPLAIHSPAARSEQPAVLTDRAFIEWLVGFAYRPELELFEQGLVEQLLAGQVPTPIAQSLLSPETVAPRWQGESDHNPFVYYANRCIETKPFDAAVYSGADTPSWLSPYLEYADDGNMCDDLNITPRPQSRLPGITIPTLFIAGGFDPVTPLADAEALAESFAESTTLVFTRGGHGFLRSEPCLADFISQFLAQQTLPAKHSCDHLEVLH